MRISTLGRRENESVTAMKNIYFSVIQIRHNYLQYLSTTVRYKDDTLVDSFY